jgi:hypothetical protein
MFTVTKLDQGKVTKNPKFWTVNYGHYLGCFLKKQKYLNHSLYLFGLIANIVKLWRWH